MNSQKLPKNPPEISQKRIRLPSCVLKSEEIILDFRNLIKNKSLNCKKYLEIRFPKNGGFVFLYVMGQRCLFSFHIPALSRPARPFLAIKFGFYRQSSRILQHPGIKNRPQAVWLKVYSGYLICPFQAKGGCPVTEFFIPTRQMNLISKHFCLEDLISFDLV